MKLVVNGPDLNLAVGQMQFLFKNGPWVTLQQEKRMGVGGQCR